MRVKHKKIAALTLFAFVIVGATEIEALTNFSDDAVIQNGDEYDYVQVYDYAIIDMTGGIVTNYLSANDYSTVNVSGGVLGGLGGGEFSTLNLSGDMQTNELSVSGSSTANVFAGSMGLVEAWNHSTVNLHGGTISDYVLAYGDESLVVNIYGYDFNYDALGGSYGGGQLTGYWSDGTGFSIDLWYSSNPGEGTIDTYSHINTVPEAGAVNSNSKIEDAIEYYVQTDKAVYVLGEEVQMLYKVTNLRDEEVTFGFPRKPVWNFWVEKDEENIWTAVNAWQYVITEFTLSPGECKEFPTISPPCVWNMRANDNNLVDVGNYDVIGGLYAGSGLYDYTKVGVGITIIPEPGAEDKIFTSSGQIVDGENWENVYIYNDHTIVDMLGGLVDSIGTYDASTVNVTGGNVSTLVAHEFSTANVSGGYVHLLDTGDHATINFSDNARAICIVAGGDFGTVNITGGTLDYLGAGGSGTLNLYGGIISEDLGAYDASTVNIYGRDLVKTASGGHYGYGQVYGFWSDGTYFTIELYTLETYSHINLITVIDVKVEILPNTLNLASKGKWINCTILLPEDYNVADVNSETIFLKDEIPAERVWFSQEQNLVMAKFRRSEVQEIVEAGVVELTITGELVDGTPFMGTDTIKVIDKGGGKD